MNDAIVNAIRTVDPHATITGSSVAASVPMTATTARAWFEAAAAANAVGLTFEWSDSSRFAVVQWR